MNASSLRAPDGSTALERSPGTILRLSIRTAVALLVLGLPGLVPPAASGAAEPASPRQVSIMDIQGSGGFSALEQTRVETSGVVTLREKNGSGFWIQDPDGDGDPATSDGLYVSQAGSSFELPQVGDLVRIVAVVAEMQRGIGLPRTQLEKPTLLEVTASDRALPAAVELHRLPDTELYDAVAFWEPLEGMRVSLKNAPIISPTNQYLQFTVLPEGNAAAGSGYYPETGVAIVRGLGGDRVDYNPERVLIDFRGLEDPPLVWVGDRVVSLEGVADFAFNNFVVQAASLEVESRPREGRTLGRRQGEKGDVRIVTYNLRDLFDTEDEPDRSDELFDAGSGRKGYPSAEEYDTRLAKHALAVIEEMELPDVIVANEFESEEVLQALGDRINQQAGTRYRALSRETLDYRGLEAGFLYDEARVELVDSYPLDAPGVDDAFNRPIEWLHAGRTEAMRQPLVGVFRFAPGTAPITIVASKLKTKRFEAPLYHVYYPTPIRNTEPLRRAQARALRAFVDRLLAEDPEAMVMIAGDLGDFPFAEPGEGEHAIGILEGGDGQVPLKNLIELEEPSEAYTWFYLGNGQALSHMLVSPSLLERCAGFDVLHFNAHHPDLDLRWDATTPVRSSDRDPLEARFELRGER